MSSSTDKTMKKEKLNKQDELPISILPSFTIPKFFSTTSEKVVFYKCKRCSHIYTSENPHCPECARIGVHIHIADEL